MNAGVTGKQIKRKKSYILFRNLFQVYKFYTGKAFDNVNGNKMLRSLREIFILNLSSSILNFGKF